MYSVSQLFIYPIKSLGGINLLKSMVTIRGLEYDRRWMLCNGKNEFITQREFKELVFFKVNFTNYGFGITYRDISKFEIPFSINGKTEPVTIWEDSCHAIEHKEASYWFSKILNFDCKLFYMPDRSERKIDKNNSQDNEINSFSDSYPILLLSEKSLENLNQKLKTKILINQFRPNIVMKGGQPFDEDKLTEFTIGKNLLKAAKPCARCVVTTINQQNGKTSAEPLKTLAQYRQFDNKVLFGQNVLVISGGYQIEVGQMLMPIN